MKLDFLHGLDPIFWILLVIIILTCVWSFSRLKSHPWFRVLLAIRVIGLFLLLFLLFQPLLTRTTTFTKQLQWNIYLDNSVSMAYHQGVSLAALNAGIEELESVLNNQQVKSNFLSFSRDVNPAQVSMVEGTGSATDLGKVMEHIKTHQDGIAASVLITDGQVTQGENPRAEAQIASPVFILGVGDSIPMVDISIKSVDAPTVTVKGEDVDVFVVIQGQGNLKKRLNVSLYRQDDLLVSKRINLLGGGAEKTVRFRFKPRQIGTRIYTVSVSSVKEEINISNNHQSFGVKVLKDRYPVALITGAPSYNTALIKRIMRSYPRIRVDHFVQHDLNKFRPDLNRFWSKSYDLIVLDNFPVTKLPTDWQRIFGKKVLNNKSSLAWVLGPNVTSSAAQSLAPFFHVLAKERLKDPQPTPWYFADQFNYQQYLQTIVGQDNPDFPPLKAGIQIVPVEKSLKTQAYLQNANQFPLLIQGEVEGLRSLVWTAPGFSSLHYKLSRGSQAEFFRNFWHGMFNWLLRSGAQNDLYFRLNKSSYQQGEEIVVTGTQAGEGRVFSARAFISIFKNGEEVNSSELHYDNHRSRWEGRLWASTPGEYSFEILLEKETATTSQKGHFEVKESQVELNRVYLNLPLLQNLARKTGGKYIPWATRAEIYPLLENKSRIEAHTSKVKFNEEPWLILGLILLLTAEWVIRRWSGLP